MHRRSFVASLGAIATLPLAARAQQPAIPTIGFLSSTSAAGWDNYLTAFRDGLSRFGFTEGKNVAIEYRWANNDYDRLPSLAAELAGMGVAAIVASGGPRPAIAAKAASSTIPIVFTGVPDPVQLGLVESLNRPGGNVTGLSILTTELLPKRFELLVGLVPGATIIGILLNPNTPSYAGDIKAAQEAAHTHGKTILSYDARSDSDFAPAFESIARQNCGALIVSSDALFNNRREVLIELSARHRIPTVFGWPEFPRVGGMASYGPDLAEQYRLSGTFVGRILKGEKPRDLPVMQPTRFILVVNLKTMKALSLEPPPNIIALADEVIE
jgi:putative tryptophan/tyrosine transport system substrate-binding protein